jgi:hypothetical protein
MFFVNFGKKVNVSQIVLNIMPKTTARNMGNTTRLGQTSYIF